MRTYRLTVSGKTYVVELEDPQAHPVHVVVDGKPFEVYVDGAVEDDESAVTPQARSAHLDEPSPAPLPRGPRTDPTVSVHGDQGAESDTLAAPMPGTILSVAVKAGDRVHVGQEVCVLEAMKMKNSIKSPREGNISEVAVSAGSSVGYDDPLLRFE